MMIVPATVQERRLTGSRGAQAIAQAAPGFQQFGGLGGHLGAEAANVDVYRSFAALEIHSPDHVQQAITGKEFAPVQAEKSAASRIRVG